jgi:CHAT domain-containing protein/Tfp pilus assembly protein PilF
MQAPRYYLVILLALPAITSSGHLHASAQSPPAGECQATSGTEPTPDSAGAAKHLIECGYTLNRAGEYARANQVFERALQVATRILDRALQAAALAGSGMTFRALGRAADAEPRLQQSLQISETLDDPDGVAEACSQLGRLRSMQARYDEARDYHLRSFDSWTAAGNRQGAAVALNNVGAMHRALGDFVTAQDYYGRSLAAFEQLGDRRRYAAVLDNMGMVARRLGDHARGIELTSQALAIREELQDRPGIANGLDSMAVSHQSSGNYAAALEALHRSLEIRRSLGAAHGTAEALANIAGVYVAQGSYAQAVDYFRQAIAANETVGSASLTAEIYSRLGAVHLGAGDTARAVRTVERGLAVSEPRHLNNQIAEGLYVLGRAYLEQGRLDAAAGVFARCLAMHESSRSALGRAEVLIEIAEIERLRRRLTDGRALADEAEQLARSMELPELRWRALTVRGRIDRTLGDQERARQAFDAAIEIVEQLRDNVAGAADVRSRFFADRQAPYRERIALALDRSDVAEAFHVAERSKARLLLDAIGGERAPITGSMTEDERTRERQLRLALNSLNGEVLMAAQAASRDESRLVRARQRRDRARLELAEFQSRLYASHPELRMRRGEVTAARVTDAAALVTSPAEAIIEFVVGRDRTWAFVATASGMRWFTLPVASRDLARHVDEFRQQLANRDLRATEGARRVYDLVLAPLEPSLRGRTGLTIVPDGPLWGLPFQALRRGSNRYVVEDMAVSYAPSVTALREMTRAARAARSEPILLAFGNPALDREGLTRQSAPAGERLEPLPDAEAQVLRLGQLYGPSSRVYTGAEADEDRWKREAGRFGIVHLATHGVLDDASPLHSYLLLAKKPEDRATDGLLEAWEIMAMRMNARLVVLSACETARGRIAAGEGVIGLMWSFFVAGTPSTLVSQWKVESGSSTELMVAFHRAWNGGRGGVSKADALQRASKALMRSEQYSHPFHWAGYILAGDRR